ncbi:hypothetical protein D9758_013291 [Tetrapyrgos nigripes]|uniref:Uncharacterized protein n=1 Tax=Tetrapyrgos nigripes TaxID=182062 RepID=A0A8H5FJN3_9AGAR|nr:hypothetical protein D9758_013291 [Tetrapyrgos nigripes]
MMFSKSQLQRKTNISNLSKGIFSILLYLAVLQLQLSSTGTVNASPILPTSKGSDPLTGVSRSGTSTSTTSSPTSLSMEMSGSGHGSPGGRTGSGSAGGTTGSGSGSGSSSGSTGVTGSSSNSKGSTDEMPLGDFVPVKSCPIKKTGTGTDSGTGKGGSGASGTTTTTGSTTKSNGQAGHNVDLKRASTTNQTLERRAHEFLGFRGVPREVADQYAKGIFPCPRIKPNLGSIDWVSSINGKVCLIYAVDADQWKQLPKIWFTETSTLPGKLVIGDAPGNNPQIISKYRAKLEDNRALTAHHYGLQVPNADASGVYPMIRFAKFISNDQMVIPMSLLPGRIVAVCYEPTDPALAAVPGFSYKAKAREWNILNAPC